MQIFSGLSKDPVEISPRIFIGLVVCVILTVVLMLYIVLFRSDQVVGLVPEYTPSSSVSNVKDNGSILTYGAGGSLYCLYMNVMPQSSGQWCSFTISPDYTFDASKIVNVTTSGTSVVDGTSTSQPAPIMQIVPVGTGSKVTVYFLANSLFAHSIYIQLRLR